MELPRIMQTTTFLCSCTVCEIMGRTGRSRGRASPHPANDRHRVQRPQPKPTHTDASSPIGAQNAPAIRPHTRIQPTRPQRPPAATPTNAHQQYKTAVATPTCPKTMMPHHPQVQRQKRNPHQTIRFITRGSRFSPADPTADPKARAQALFYTFVCPQTSFCHLYTPHGDGLTFA